jgi:hypothetical protein
MPKSKVQIEADREHFIERINHLHVIFSDVRRCRERDNKTTLIWMLQINISKLLKLPLPEFLELISQQLCLFEKLDEFVASNIPDRLDDLRVHCARLRRKEVEISQSNPVW